MALARIFSRYPEHTTELCRQLQEHGYDVEVLSPEEISTTAADLEIQMEACDPADVLRRAAEMASQLNVDIAVAPDVFPTGSEEIVPALAPPVAVSEPAVIAETAAAHPATDFQECREKRAAVPGFLLGAARASGARLAAGVAGVRDLLAAGGAGFRERWERSRIRTVEVRARRQEMLLDLTRRRLEASQRAVDLEGVRRAADLALLQQNDADWPPRSPSAWPRARAATARIWRIPTRKAMVAGAALLAACFAVGLAVASFHSRQPVSSSQGVTVHGVDGKTVSVPLEEAQPKAALPQRPSPILRPAPGKPAAHARRARHSAPRHENAVADDVVVRHYATPKPTPRAQADGWKHFSDTSN